MEVNIIYGPPGTGKTTHLLNILSKEIQNYSLNEIAYVSFTKKGSEEGKERAIKELKISLDELPYFRTLHSIAFRETNMNRADIIDKKYYKMFSEKMKMYFTGYYTEELKHSDDRYLFFNILHRNNPQTAQQYLYNLDTDKLKLVSYNYRRFKEYHNIYDFTDMIEIFIADNKALPIKIAIVDEAQDLTTLQWKMIWVAFRNCEKIYIAGDDDQAIYEWSGADVKYLLKLTGNVSVLDKSYRLPKNILNFSKNITRMISHRIEKEYYGLDECGDVIYLNSVEELTIDNNETWMFLSRNVCFLKDVIEIVQNYGLIYKHRGKLSVMPSKIAAIKLFEKVRKTMMMSKVEEIKLQSHLKDKYDLRLPWYDNFSWKGDEKTYYRDIIKNKTKLDKCNIIIDTIHSVKGGEADNVVLLLDITHQVSLNLTNNPDSEHRIFYVGCTRAKKKLYIVYGENKFQYTIYKE